MIVRTGINVHYTHDEDAMITEWCKLREFAGVPRQQMLAWIAAERAFSWSADYWHIPADGEFISTRVWLYNKPAETVCVSLWKAVEFTRFIIEKHGFSCVACGAHSTFDKRGNLYSYYGDTSPHGLIREAIRVRQEVWAPDLICQECAIDLPMVLLPFVVETKRMQVVDRLISRAVSLPETSHV